MTIGRVLARGEDKGSGFAIAPAAGRSSRIVLTAAHLVRGRDASSIEFLVSAGRTIRVEQVESDEEIDIAVLHLCEEVDGFVATRVRERLAWQVDARPRGNDPRLTGVVSDPQRPFSTARGPDIHVVQLHVDQTVGNYQGYSGSPVMLGLTESPPVLGVLIEQLRWRTPTQPGQSKAPASNVLYAIAIQDALARFGLDTTWMPASGLPSDEELVRRYLEAVAARFDERFGATPHVALALQRGTRTPTVVPEALRRQQARLRELLKPRLSTVSPGPGSDSGQPVADLGDFQERCGRVVLLGRPGAGKSVTLRHLVARLGAPWTSGSAGDTTKIPIFADLSEWHDHSAGLPAFLETQLTSLGQHALAERLSDLMRTDRLVLLLDGLNEMSRLRRDPATDHLDDPRVEAIAELGKRADWNAVGCVLSCRSNDFRGGPEWNDLYLLDLDGDRVVALAEAYLHDLPDAPAVIRDFLRRLDPSASGRLRGLISNPFFLVMALAYYAEMRTIPDRPTDLLVLTVAEALEREHVGDRADELRRQLGRLAFRMTADGEFGAVDPARAAAWLAPDGETPVDAATAGFVRRSAEGAGLLTTSGDEIRFSHQLIQEFLAASYLHEKPLTASLVEIVAQPQFDEIWSWWADLEPALAARLIPFLGDTAAGVRRAAATILGALRDRRAADPLARVLTDPDATVSWSAALSLASLRDDRATPALVDRLRDGESGVRQLAAQTLSVLDDPRAVDPLVDALRRDESGDVRAAAATALGASADGRVLRPLVEVLVESGDGALSRAAARALGRLRDPRAVPDLLALLDESAVRPGAVDGLLAIGEAAMDPLMDLLRHDRNARRRENAAFVLGLSHRPRAIPALITALTDAEPDVQQQSASALGHFGEPALAPLLDVLDGDAENAQTWALYALGVMADPRAVPHLLAALQSDSEEVAGQAVRSLRSCGDSAVGPLVDILLDDADPQTSWHAATALGGLGEPGAAALVTAAGSDDPFVRMLAVVGLAEAVERAARFAAFFSGSVDPVLIESLAAALYDTEPIVRRLAAAALAEIGDVRAVPSLATMIRSGEAELRTAALRQLGRVEDASAVDILVTALRDTEAEIRQAACEALYQLLSRPRSIRVLVDAADSRNALTQLLSTWRATSATPALLPALRRAMPPLVAALRDPESAVVSAARKALNKAAKPLVDVSVVLANGADGEDPALQALVREILVPLSDPAAVAALIGTLDHLDDESDDWHDLRSSIAELLGAVGDQRAVPAMIHLLRSSRGDVCTTAARALAHLGGPDALPAMISALNTSPSFDVAFPLTGGILALADDRAPGLLLDALRDPAPDVGGHIEDLLRALGELALVPLVTALGDDDPELARAAARALDPAERGFLGYRRNDRRWRAAIEALDRLSGIDVDSLVAATHRDDEQVTRVARALLAKLGHPAARAAEAEPPAVPPEPPRTLVELIDMLASDDEEARADAATALGSRGDRAAVGPLTARLADDAEKVRAAVALAPGQLGVRSVVDRLGSMLADPSWLVVHNAALGLGMLGGRDALRLILDALDSGFRRGLAARALRTFDEQSYQEIGVVQTVDALLTSVRQERTFHRDSDDYAVYAAALEVLPKLGEPALTLLLTALDDSHDAVRHLAAKALAAGADLRALPLLAWMEEHDRGEYVSGGGKPKDAARSAYQDIQGAHRAREPLIDAMASNDRLTRYGAAFQLAHREWLGAAPTLIDALHDPDHRIRWGAAQWLGELGDERGIAPLIASLGDPDKAVRDNVAASLTRFGPAAAPSAVAALDALDPDTRAQAAIVLGSVGGADEVAALIGALGDTMMAVCEAAAYALNRLAGRGMTEGADSGVIAVALITAFHTIEQHGTGDYSHLSVVNALTTFDEARTVDLLIEALGSRHRSVRLTAVKHLGELGDRRAIAPLNQALSDEDWMVTEDAADSLRKFADVSSVEPLIERLPHGEGFPLVAAIEALAAIGDPRAAAPLVPLLRNDFDQARTAAANTIVALTDAAAIELLVADLGVAPGHSYLSFDDTPAKPLALDVLVRIGAPAAGALIDALADEATSAELRGACAAALGGIGDPRALPALDGAADDASELPDGRTVAAVAAEAAAQIRFLAEERPELDEPEFDGPEHEQEDSP